MRSVGKFIKYITIGIYALCGLALLVFLVPSSGLQAKSVLTGSMQPAISTGSLVIIQKTPLSGLKVGDIITYKAIGNNGKTITHRIVKAEKRNQVPYFTTKGDANAANDPEIVGGRVVGKVVAHIPALGTIAEWAKNPIGLAVIIIIPGVVIIVDESRRLRRLLSRSSPEPAPAPTAPAPVAPVAAELPPQATHRPKSSARTRSLDGMAGRKLVVFAAFGLLLAGAVGTTHAAMMTNTVKLTNNSVQIISVPSVLGDCKNGGWEDFFNPDGSPMFKNQGQCIAFVNALNHGQCPEIHISNTGAGSTNIVICKNKNKIIITSTNNISVTTTNNQSASTGDVNSSNNTSSSTTTSGGASNSNSSSTTVNVSNF